MKQPTSALMKRLRVELHCHTHASSDGVITPDGLLKAAELQKLDVIAITDHDTTVGAFEFQRWFQRKGSATQIIIGEERTLANQCHLIGLFLKQDITSTDPIKTMEEIHEQGGLVLVPHPCRKGDGLLGPRGLGMAALDQVDAFEIHNAKGSRADNDRTLQLTLQAKRACFGGSDAHYEADVGQCVNEIQACGDVEETLRAMFRRETPFRILAKAQKPSSDERRYAPAYYAMKKYAAIPKALVPLAKQAYRLYWNHKHGGHLHELTELMNSETAPSVA
jgi:predicted metal-dependent phosphoesterase TrpH